MADPEPSAGRGTVHVHDFAGHPFQAELSRELAARGFTVEHAFAAQYPSGKGRLTRQPGDPEGLSFLPVESRRPFEKYSPVGRLRFERSYLDIWTDHLRRRRPDLVIAANTPLFVMHRFSRFARRIGLPYVLWHQDILSMALGEELQRRLDRRAVPAALVRTGQRLFTHAERDIVKSARRVVAIDDVYVREYETWGLDTSHVRVIPNWAPIDEIVPQQRDNAWSRANLGEHPDRLRLLYAGTLGRKHNPLLLIDLIEMLRDTGVDAELTVVSEGEGADVLSAAAAERPAITDHVHLLPFQPVEDLSEVLGSGDVLVALLEPGASRFSIPSKVLSYLAAGRPVVGIMQPDNPAAVDIEKVGGCVVEPDQTGVTAAVAWLAELADDADRRAELGTRSRDLAVRRFGIDAIADRFVETIEGAEIR